MELRHLRYFTSVVESGGYREASRRMHISQPSISEAISDLEYELGVKLFSRANRKARLTPEGEMFYAEAVRTLEQVETAVVTAKRAAQGKIGKLSIGFIGSATLSCLPDLIRRYKLEYPGVRLALHDLYPVELDAALDSGMIDLAITRTLPLERSRHFASRPLLRDPLVVALPTSRKVRGTRIRLSKLADERFILFHRKGAPGVFDTIVGACRDQGFSPRVENEQNSMQTILSLVEAEEGIAIVPASTGNLRSNGVQFISLDPGIYLDLIAAWPAGEPTAVLRTFLEFLDRNEEIIRSRADAGMKLIGLLARPIRRRAQP